MAKFDYMAEFGYSADELREAIEEISEKTGKQKREVWYSFINYTDRNIDNLRAFYARAIEKKRLMDAGRELFTMNDDDDGDDDQ